MTLRTAGPLQALILAGGLSRRLGGVPKAGLEVAGQSLLARTVDAVARVLDDHLAATEEAVQRETVPEEAVPETTTAEAAANARAGIAVVGPGEKIANWLATAQHGTRTRIVQEDPPFSGPAAGIAAGLEALTGNDGHVLVLACDMPQAGTLASALVAAMGQCTGADGVMAVSEGKKQPLAAIYPLAALRASAETARAAHRLENASVFSLVANVNMKECAVASALTADIDTWADARAQGIAAVPADAEG